MAGTLTLQPNLSAGIDTYIISTAGDVAKNYGASPSIVIGVDAGTNKGLLKFDLSALAAIPAANILTAVLTLNVSSENNAATDPTLELHKALTQWFPGVQIAVAPPGGQDGSTWNHRNANGSVAWAGGAGGGSGSDYAAAVSASVTINGTGNYTFNVLADVQAWVGTPASNHGWWLICNPMTVNTGKVLLSADSGSANRPKLVITYNAPSIRATMGGTSGLAGTLAINPRYGFAALQPHGAAGLDSRIRQSTPTANSGGQVLISVGWDKVADARRRGQIKFELSSIPATAIITSARIQLHMMASSDVAPANITAHRSLNEWYEGTLLDTVPGAGVDGSTWNLRNAHGSVAWGGGPGGAAGTEWLNEASDTELVVPSTSIYSWDVTQDVQDFVNGTYPNYGWWLLGVESGAASTVKSFDSSDGPDAGHHPMLIVEYSDPAVEMQASLDGASSLAATLRVDAEMSATLAGTSLLEGELTNVAVVTQMAGTSALTGNVVAYGQMSATLAGVGSVAAILRGRAALQSTILSGPSLLDANAQFVGMMVAQLQGTSDFTARASAQAIGVLRPRIQNPAPLLYLTDGGERFELLNRDSGFLVCGWKPNLAQYKNGGQWSDSAQANGRRLIMRRYANAIEVITLSATGKDQDELALFTNDLLRWKEAAADFWSSRWAANPVYLVSRAAYEQNERYALVYAASVPELENIYDQPFFTNPARGRGRPAWDEVVLRIERGPWLENAPGIGSAVAISSVRSWTVAGWETSS